MTRYRGRLSKGDVIRANALIKQRAKEKLRVKVQQVPERESPRLKKQQSNARRDMIRRFTAALGTPVHECIYCGKAIDSNDSEEYTMDHLVPLRSGGSWNPANLRPCCRSCNEDKSCLHHDEWLNILYRNFENSGSNDPHQLVRIMRVQAAHQYVVQWYELLITKG